VPKPEGFDLRLARATKENSGKCWTPQDILYDASQLMQASPPTQAALVAWYTRLPNGNLQIKYQCSFEHDRQAVALAADLLKDLQG
jgi:hypothetical protein